MPEGGIGRSVDVSGIIGGTATSGSDSATIVGWSVSSDGDYVIVLLDGVLTEWAAEDVTIVL